MKRALVIQHVGFEGLAGLAGPVAEAGYAVEHVLAPAAGFEAVDLVAPDLLIVMGGPMAVYEHAEHPWMAGEIARVGARIAARRPTLGICLGAQVIARAMGAAVAPGRVREVGYAPLALTGAGAASPVAGLAGLPVLHWHGDVFDVPDGAVLLARTEAAPQIFAVDEVILALQCHVEMGAPDDGVEQWIGESDGYIEGAGTDSATILADRARFGPAAVAAGADLFACWLAGLA
ncbi:MAG TPA: glutamine amidotransferase [Sphingomonas sp.]